MENEPIDSFPQFEEKTFSDGFASVLDFEENQELWERFRFAFESRAQLPWLGEAEDDHHTYAERLAYALGSVAFESHARPLENKIPENAKLALDADFIEAVREASVLVSKDAFNRYKFAHHLRYAGFHPEHMSAREISKEIKVAIHSYWDRHELGRSSDPW